MHLSLAPPVASTVHHPHAWLALQRTASAADAHRTAVAEQRLDRKALVDIGRAGQVLVSQLDELAARATGYPAGDPRGAEFAHLLTRTVDALADLPGTWALPAESMQPYAKVQKGALELRSLTDGGGEGARAIRVALARIANGLRTAASPLVRIEQAPDGPTARLAGLARLAEDSVLRLRDGARSALAPAPLPLPGRSFLQAETATMQLQRMVADAGADLASPIADAITGGIDELARHVDSGSRSYPTSAAALATASTALADAAQAAADALDARLGELRLAPDQAERAASWRELPRGARGTHEYFDPDLGW